MIKIGNLKLKSDLLLSPMSGVSKRIGSAFSSPIKKFEQVVGLILGGIFINVLPPLVSKIKNAFDGVKKRFDQINSVIKKILEFINAITEPIKQLFGFVGASNNINPNGSFIYRHDCSDTPNEDYFLFKVKFWPSPLAM